MPKIIRLVSDDARLTEVNIFSLSLSAFRAGNGVHFYQAKRKRGKSFFILKVPKGVRTPPTFLSRNWKPRFCLKSLRVGVAKKTINFNLLCKGNNHGESVRSGRVLLGKG